MALVFNPGSDSIRTVSNFGGAGIAAMTFWARTTSSSGRIIGSNTNWETRKSSTALLHEFRTGSSIQSAANTITFADWNHYVLNFESPNKSIYVNGVANPAPSNQTFGGTQDNFPLAIGTSAWQAGEGVQGSIEDVRYYDREITQPEAQTMFAAEGRDGILDGLVDWWPLTDGVIGASPTAIPDHAAGGFDMTNIVGFVFYEASRSICSGGSY